jgi:hypothetical protein
MNTVKVVFLFYFLSTSDTFSKSDEYYRMTLMHLLVNSECNTKCKKIIFKQEIKYLFYQLFERLLEKIRIELLDEQGKEDKYI